MTRNLLVSLAVLAGCSTTAPTAAPTSAAPAPAAAAQKIAAKVDGPTAKSLVANGALLVDVRSVVEFDGGHIEGARNIPVDTLASALTTLPKDKPIVVYCAAGFRAARAAQLLADAGFDARNLGAMSSWPR